MMHSFSPVALLLLAGALTAAAQSPAPAHPTDNGKQTTAGTAPAAANTILVPEGTKVLLELRSAINTKSAKPGDGVYLASTFPVAVGGRVIIPAGVYVQGVIDEVVRPGRIHGKAQLNMHFTSIIFPNGSVMEIPGMVNALPGSKEQSVKGQEGTIQQDGGSNKGHNAGEVAKVSVPTGAGVGSIGGLSSGHPLAGGLEGAGVGLAAAGIVALLTHNADVNIPSGSQVEMVIQHPIELPVADLTGAPSLVPANAPGTGPVLHQRPAMVCPAGSLGCN
jgi:hypothetical protein